MTAFSRAAEAIFRNPNIALDAQWISGGGLGPGNPIRVVLSAPDVDVGFGSGRVGSETMTVSALVSQISNPARGDVIVLNDTRYSVQGLPERDIERLIWRLELVAE